MITTMPKRWLWGFRVIRMGFPGLVTSMGETMLANEAVLRVLGALQVALGAFLMMKGYF